MDKIILEQLLKKNETQTLELKKSLSLLDKGLESLCAMTNSDFARGMLIFGVEPDGTTVGIEPGNLDSVQRKIAQSINSKFDPKIVFNIHVMELDNKNIIIINAERPKSVPYYEYNGRAWIREGSINKLLGIEEKNNLNKRRNRNCHNGPWKCDRCGCYVGILCSYTYSDKGMEKTYNCNCGGEYWPI
jgi:predicted HTH transcriptional regulator